MKTLFTTCHRQAISRVAIIACTSLLSTLVSAQNPLSAADDADFYNFVEPWGPIPLTLSTDRIWLRFNDDVSVSAQDAVLAAEPAVDPAQPVTIRDNTGAMLVRLQSGLDKAAVYGSLERLSKAAEVYYATPVVQSVRGLHAATTNRFYVSFDAPAPEEELMALGDAYGVELIGKRTYEPIGRVGFWLRTAVGSTLNALAMSNLFYHELGPAGAGPNFVALYDTLAATPNDTYFSSQCTQPAYKYQCNLSAINVPAAWDITRWDPVGQQYKYVARGSEHIVVAVLDTGVDLYYGQGYPGHEDLNANQWFNENDPIGGGDDDGNGLVDDYYGWDFCDDDNVPFDESVGGHGTSSAGVVAGVTNNSAGIAGIAGGWAPNIPGCRIMPIRVVSFPCTATSLADVGAVTQGILYAADMGAHVLTMSLGVYDATQDLTDAVRYARACGSVLVAAAHNFDNYDDMGPGYPARYPEVICVGALNRRQVANDTVQRKFGSETQGPSEFGEDNRGPGQRYGGGPCIEQHPEDCNVCLDYVDGWGSNFGPQLDIMAPGMEIWTTDTSGALGHNDNQYANWDYNASENPEFWYNKTSSATPQVAGVVALVLSATLGVDDKPTLAPEQVQAILQFTADDMHYNRDDYEIAGPGRDIYTGYGRVNAEAAVQLAIAPRFVVHQEGQHALSIDSAGNLVLTGDLCESATTQQMTQTGAREFLIKEGANVILILKSGADLYLKGKLYEAADVDLDTALTEQSFRVRSTDGETVAAVNGSSFVNTTLEPEAPYTVPAGSLILRGRAFLATDPDRESSQGI